MVSVRPLEPPWVSALSEYGAAVLAAEEGVPQRFCSFYFPKARGSSSGTEGGDFLNYPSLNAGARQE